MFSESRCRTLVDTLDLRVAGVVQLRTGYYIVVLSITFSSKGVYETAVRAIDFVGIVSKSHAAKIINDQNIDYGFLDNEPDRYGALELTKQTKLVLSDQRHLEGNYIKRRDAHIDGVEIVCFDYPKFMCAVRRNFSKKLVIPGSLHKDKSLEDLNIQFNPDTGNWEKTSCPHSDFYLAMMQAEAAFYTWLQDRRK